MMYFDRPTVPRFSRTFCSQCGSEFGPGNSGFSHCHTHRPYYVVLDKAGGIVARRANAPGARRVARQLERLVPNAIYTVAMLYPERRG